MERNYWLERDPTDYWLTRNEYYDCRERALWEAEVAMKELQKERFFDRRVEYPQCKPCSPEVYFKK